jgi:ABC-type uncharacterized transport system permease subunit
MRRLYCIVAALLIPAASLATALVAVAGLVLILGENPRRALLTLFCGALRDPEGIRYTLFYATDYVFAGLAVALPLQAGLFNIGWRTSPPERVSPGSRSPCSDVAISSGSCLPPCCSVR